MTNEQIAELLNQVIEKQVELDNKVNKLYGVFNRVNDLINKVDVIEDYVSKNNQWAVQNDEKIEIILSALHNNASPPSEIPEHATEESADAEEPVENQE